MLFLERMKGILVRGVADTRQTRDHPSPIINVRSFRQKYPTVEIDRCPLPRLDELARFCIEIVRAASGHENLMELLMEPDENGRRMFSLRLRDFSRLIISIFQFTVL